MCYSFLSIDPCNHSTSITVDMMTTDADTDLEPAGNVTGQHLRSGGGGPRGHSLSGNGKVPVLAEGRKVRTIASSTLCVLPAMMVCLTLRGVCKFVRLTLLMMGAGRPRSRRVFCRTTVFDNDDPKSTGGIAAPRATRRTHEYTDDAEISGTYQKSLFSSTPRL